MPWRVAKSSRCPSSKPWGVIVQDSGRVVACHKTRKSAINQQRRLYAMQGRGEIKSRIKSSLMTWKQADGAWRWFAVYSNRFRDKDAPPEIISEAAHIDFAESVLKGQWEYPELWLWHIPGSRVGVSDFIAYAEDSGMALASGVFDKGKERVAEALNSSPASLRVSHGMPFAEIHRDAQDNSVIVRYRSKEISPLPAQVAANELTGLVIGDNMKIVPEQLKEKFRQLFGDVETADEMEALIDTLGTEAKERGLAYKDAEGEAEDNTEAAPEDSGESTDEPTADKQAEDTTVADAAVDAVEPVEDVVVEPAEPTDTTKETASDTAADATADITTLVSELARAIHDTVSPLAAEVVELRKQVTALQATDEVRISKQVDMVPAASLAALIARQYRAINSKATEIDGRRSLAKDKPQETKADDAADLPWGPARIMTNIISASNPSPEPEE